MQAGSMMRTSRVPTSGPLAPTAPRRVAAAVPSRTAAVVARSYWDSYYSTGGSAPSNGNGNYPDSHDDDHSEPQHSNGSSIAYFGSGSYDQEEDAAYGDDDAYLREQVPHAFANGAAHGPGPGKEDVQQAIATNPLFNSQFMNVLQDSLARQGPDSLTNAPPVEDRVSATEEVLTVALGHSKLTLQQLMAWREQVERQIAVQQKQVDRIGFALNKSRGDAAYMRALKNMMAQD